MQQPQIVEVPKRKLVGMHIETTLANDQTVAMWQRFMPRRKEIARLIDGIYFSVQVYPAHFKMEDFTSQTIFEKWAAVEVTDLGPLPEGMESSELAAGKYAVFVHRGTTATFPKTMQYIYQTWLPQSDHELDDRPLFEIMGDKYLAPDNPDSEEEVWIPLS